MIIYTSCTHSKHIVWTLKIGDNEDYRVNLTVVELTFENGRTWSSSRGEVFHLPDQVWRGCGWAILCFTEIQQEMVLAISTTNFGSLYEQTFLHNISEGCIWFDYTTFYLKWWTKLPQGFTLHKSGSEVSTWKVIVYTYYNDDPNSNISCQQSVFT